MKFITTTLVVIAATGGVYGISQVINAHPSPKDVAYSYALSLDANAVCYGKPEEKDPMTSTLLVSLTSSDNSVKSQVLTVRKDGRAWIFGDNWKLVSVADSTQKLDDSSVCVDPASPAISWLAPVMDIPLSPLPLPQRP